MCHLGICATFKKLLENDNIKKNPTSLLNYKITSEVNELFFELIKEKYNKPVAVIAIDKGIGKASCRSIKNIDFGCKIIEAKQNNLLINGGGHAMAAGFTVKENKLKELEEFFNTEFEQDLKKSDEHLYEYYDIDLTINAANLDLISEINKLEPFGVGNPNPIFKFSNLYILKSYIIGEKHIKVILMDKNRSSESKVLNAIAFNSVNTTLGNILLSSKKHPISLFGQLKINKWQNQETIQLHIIDLLKHDLN